MEKHFADFQRTLKDSGPKAADALLLDLEFQQSFTRALMVQASQQFKDVESSMKEQHTGTYAYSKSVHHALRASIVLLTAQGHMREQLRQMRKQCDQDRMKALEARIATLETSPLHYDGPHETGKVYDKGVFVTHDGSVWHCNYKTASRPGEGPAWTLAVKRGKDAR